MKKYIVTLTEDERLSLSALVSSGKAAAKFPNRSRMSALYPVSNYACLAAQRRMSIAERARPRAAR